MGKKSIARAQDIFLDRVNQICNKFGLNNIMAQLYAVLYLTPKPMSLNEMTEQLKISKGSVSTNIRALERYGAVRKVWVKGSRRDYYEAETDISKVISERVASLVQHRLSEIDSMITASEGALNSEVSFSPQKEDREDYEMVKVFMQRLGALKELHRKAKSLFDVYSLGLLNSLLTSKSEITNKKEALASKP